MADGQRFWIIVGSIDNFRTTAELGFTVQGMKSRHRKKAERMGPGDKIVYYLTGLKAFAGVATIDVAVLREPRTNLGERRPEEGGRRLPVPRPHRARVDPAGSGFRSGRRGRPADGLRRQVAGRELDTGVSGKRSRDRRR